MVKMAAVTCGLVMLLLTSLTRSSESILPTGGRTEQMPRALASPLNIDPKLDCAVKELAWEYAKKLLPRVSPYGVSVILCTSDTKDIPLQKKH